MAAVVLSPRALLDLVEIWAYIAEDSPSQADKFSNQIDSKFRTLASQPGMGRPRPELCPGLRSIPIGRFVIFYFSRVNGVEIVRVLHGARDLGAIIDEL
jgi:toxin ParE1/3/4